MASPRARMLYFAALASAWSRWPHAWHCCEVKPGSANTVLQCAGGANLTVGAVAG